MPAHQLETKGIWIGGLFFETAGHMIPFTIFGLIALRLWYGLISASARFVTRMPFRLMAALMIILVCISGFDSGQITGVIWVYTSIQFWGLAGWVIDTLLTKYHEELMMDYLCSCL
ncbi:MAG: hypothetical protein EOP88_27125 [Verrucomicrobiaceae bacterium]|nr:MAG: hypothetical protein EOP88_27125 [Verrucomicrobiaceae bacterium]